MRKFCFLFFSAVLLAQDAPDFESRSIWDFHPIHVGGNFIWIGAANVCPRHESNDSDLKFNKTNAFLYTFVPVNRCSFFLPRVEYNRFTMDWNRNPRFNETTFQFMQFALTFLTMSLETWRWIARVDYNIDIKHFSKPKRYSLFSALLWGTHELHRKWHYHIGLFGYTGFSGQEVYPIIGLDYAPNKKWMFQFVFPVNYSIEYSFNPRWRLSLKGRPLKERFRSGKFEPDPRCVFNYSTMGAELNLHYEKFLNLEVEIYAGYNFGGSFYIKDRDGHRPLYTDVGSAPYAGASLNWGT